jgi:hypothetical protein
MCENTLLALRQVTNEMRNYDSIEEFTSDMGREELAAFKRLFDVCEEFIMMKEDMEQFDEYNKESSNA